jgi:hypothetical protein
VVFWIRKTSNIWPAVRLSITVKVFDGEAALPIIQNGTGRTQMKAIRGINRKNFMAK